MTTQFIDLVSLDETFNSGTPLLEMVIFPIAIESEESFVWVVQPIGLGSLFTTGSAKLGIQIQPTGIVSQETFYSHSIGNITLKSSIADANNQFGYPNIVNVSPVPLLSSQIAHQLPQFVQEDHPNFINFMEAYYEWLENYRNVQFDIARVLNYQDVDTSIDDFAEQFFKEFLFNIPRSILADKKLILKHIREFYRAKGTEKSYRFFFRILFNTDIDFYFPRVDILRVSDGKWIQPTTLKVQQIVGNPFDLVGRRIRGLTSNASAFVEQVQIVQEGFLTVHELFLNKSSISGIFSLEEKIVVSNTTIEAQILPIVVKINVISGGVGYQVGQEVLISGVGVGAKAEIQSVSSTGAIQKVKITNFGAGYTTTPIVTVPIYDGVTELADLTATVGSLATYPGFFLNEDGQISSSKYIQDGKYYQQFSYVVYVNESIEKYRDALKQLIHPAGLNLYGGFRSQELISAKTQLPSKYGQSQSTIILVHEHFKFVWVVYDINNQPLNYFDTEALAQQWLKESTTLPYTEIVVSDYIIIDNDEKVVSVFPTYSAADDWLSDNPSLFNQPLRIFPRTKKIFKSVYLQRRDTRDVIPYYHDPIDARMKSAGGEMVLIHDFNEMETSFKLGPSYRSIERDKFYYKPFERRDVTGEMVAANAGYWGVQGVLVSQFANYQIKDFKDITVKEMTEKPWTKINIVPEPILKNSDETGIPSGEKFGILMLSSMD